MKAVKPYPRGTLQTARKEARRLQVIVDAGANPRLEQKAVKEAARIASKNKFAAAANDWHAFQSRAWAKRTADQVREYLDKDLIPSLGNMLLDKISPEQLAKFLEAINRRAPDVAKKMRQWLQVIFSYSRGKGWTKADPTKDLKAITLLGVPSERHAHLPFEEFPSFLQKLTQVEANPSVEGATWLAIWAANRPGVTRTLRWSEVDLDKGLWSIQKGRDEMKGKYAHITPLSQQAVIFLRDQQQISGVFEHVFIGRNDPGKSISDGAVKVLLDRMGYAGKQTMHGFRHVASSVLNGMSYPTDHIERQLAHTDTDKIQAFTTALPIFRSDEKCYRIGQIGWTEQ